MNQLVPNNIQPLRRKLYDLFAATPLIGLYLFGLSQMLSPLGQQIALAKLFIQTDPSVLPAVFVLSIVSNICTAVFFALLVVMFAVRRVPLHYPIAFYPRFVAVAGTFLGFGIVMLAPCCYPASTKLRHPERANFGLSGCRPALNFDVQVALLKSPMTAKRITAPMTALIISATMPPMKTNPIRGKSQPAMNAPTMPTRMLPASPKP
jgi:hypothetical protein